jgi:ABC-type multidrug transport system fused ATPase/permease subunit
MTYVLPGASSMPLELVIAAAEVAGAHEFILELPHGYDTLSSANAAHRIRAVSVSVSASPSPAL